MAVIQLSDWFYGLKHSEIMQKKSKQFYYENVPGYVCNPGSPRERDAASKR